MAQNINDQKWSNTCLPKHHLDAAHTNFQKSSTPTKTQQSKWTHWVSKWSVSHWKLPDNPGLCRIGRGHLTRSCVAAWNWVWNCRNPPGLEGRGEVHPLLERSNLEPGIAKLQRDLGAVSGWNLWPSSASSLATMVVIVGIRLWAMGQTPGTWWNLSLSLYKYIIHI